MNIFAMVFSPSLQCSVLDNIHYASTVHPYTEVEQTICFIDPIGIAEGIGQKAKSKDTGEANS